jgi:hypothetical protein
MISIIAILLTTVLGVLGYFISKPSKGVKTGHVLMICMTIAGGVVGLVKDQQSSLKTELQITKIDSLQNEARVTKAALSKANLKLSEQMNINLISVLSKNYQVDHISLFFAYGATVDDEHLLDKYAFDSFFTRHPNSQFYFNTVLVDLCEMTFDATPSHNHFKVDGLGDIKTQIIVDSITRYSIQVSKLSEDGKVVVPMSAAFALSIAPKNEILGTFGVHIKDRLATGELQSLVEKLKEEFDNMWLEFFLDKQNSLVARVSLEISEPLFNNEEIEFTIRSTGRPEFVFVNENRSYTSLYPYMNDLPFPGDSTAEEK